MVRGYIYRHWIINDKGIEKSYIGKTTKKNPERRWQGEGSGYTHSRGKKANNKFKNAIDKYGWDNFSHEIIGIVESNTREQLEKDLNEWEIYYIEKYDSFHNGYNSTTGGDGGKLMSEESKKKMSNSKKGCKNPNYGKKMSEEQKGKIRESLIGDKNPRAKKIKCITTGEIFNTIDEAQKKYNCFNISKCCNGKAKSCGKHPTTGEKLEWCYCSNES